MNLNYNIKPKTSLRYKRIDREEIKHIIQSFASSGKHSAKIEGYTVRTHTIQNYVSVITKQMKLENISSHIENNSIFLINKEVIEND